jgi:hypothetical protein
MRALHASCGQARICPLCARPFGHHDVELQHATIGMLRITSYREAWQPSRNMQGRCSRKCGCERAQGSMTVSRAQVVIEDKTNDSKSTALPIILDSCVGCISLASFGAWPITYVWVCTRCERPSPRVRAKHGIHDWKAWPSQGEPRSKW